MKVRAMIIVAMASVLFAGAPAYAALDKPVKTKAGLVSGVTGDRPGVTVFKGIPFAVAPVGDLRWKPPQPVKPWKGVRAADKYGDVCVQPTAPKRTPVNSATDLPGSPGMSEDCLNLNVWTPAKRGNEKLPVMVWYYGGAYNEGGGNAPFSRGDSLATKGVVVVTTNYRVGALGFLSHPELTAESPRKASGNYALMDAIATLQWVKDNIAAFGGDPNNVTVFGESAGACFSAALAGSPAAKGLLNRAISESGAWMGLGITKMMPREAAEAATVEAAKRIGATSLAQLRAMPASEISTKLRGQGLIVDGWVIPEDMSVTFAAGRQNPVDVLVGSNGDEGSFGASFGPPVTLESWQKGAPQRWKDLADAGLAVYPAKTDAEAKAVAIQPFSDSLGWLMRLFADSQAKIGKKAWFYHFTHVPPYAPGTTNLGASHTSELPYVFDNLAAPRTFPDRSSPELAAADPREQAFARQVSAYWVNFARTGDPNGPGLPQWPSVKELGPTEAMVLDIDGSGRGPWLAQPKIDFYQKIYNRDVAAR